MELQKFESEKGPQLLSDVLWQHGIEFTEPYDNDTVMPILI